MSRKTVTPAEDSTTVVLPSDLLEMMAVTAGDEVEVSVVDRTLIVRPLDEFERALTIEAATASVFERRTSAYEELAKGAE